MLMRPPRCGADARVDASVRRQVGHVSFQSAEAGEMTTQKPYSDETARLIDQQVQALVKFAFSRTQELLHTHTDDVDRVARRLLDKEVLQREDMIELLGKRPFAEKHSYDEIVEGTSAATPSPPPSAPPKAPEAPVNPAPAPAV